MAVLLLQIKSKSFVHIMLKSPANYGRPIGDFKKMLRLFKVRFYTQRLYIYFFIIFKIKFSKTQPR